jgi:hypothetical protein
MQDLKALKEIWDYRVIKDLKATLAFKVARGI